MTEHEAVKRSEADGTGFYVESEERASAKEDTSETPFQNRRKSKLPKINERFIKSIDGKDFAFYAGLLDLAHQRNLTSLEVELLQYPNPENGHTAICRATGKTANGGIFIDIGDANPQNCNAKVVKHIIRMASTRAKARCLRDMTNIGMACLEELGDMTEVIGAEEKTGEIAAARKNNVRKFPATQEQSEKSKGRGKTPMMSDAQKSAIDNLSRRRGISIEELENRAMKTFNMPLAHLTHENAASFIRTLQQAA